MHTLKDTATALTRLEGAFGIPFGALQHQEERLREFHKALGPWFTAVELDAAVSIAIRQLRKWPTAAELGEFARQHRREVAGPSTAKDLPRPSGSTIDRFGVMWRDVLSSGKPDLALEKKPVPTGARHCWHQWVRQQDGTRQCSQCPATAAADRDEPTTKRGSRGR